MKNDVDRLSGVTEIGGGKYERYNLLRDFFEMLAIRISNAVDPVHYIERSDQYRKIIERYTDSELYEFERYIAILCEILQTNLRFCRLEDTLGRLYERNCRLQQSEELTPHCMSELMGRIVMDSQSNFAEKEFITLTDSTCGSGGSFLASVQRFMELGHNPVSELVVLANDINARSVQMAYIQASLYAVPAIITQADIFTMEEVTRWYTPAYILGQWVWRCPVNHIAGRNRDDELLKIMTDPMYAAIRRMQGWVKEEAQGDENY